MPSSPKTTVYIDGFNLYYGALKGTPFRWLDLSALAANLLPKNDVQLIKYFTARVKSRPSRHDPAADQQAYLRALGTLPNLRIYYGHYLSHVRRLPMAAPGGGVLVVNGQTQFASVLKEEEKGSDVNLAAHLVHDAHLGRFEVAVVVSNDSDLATPVELVAREIGLPVGVVNPHADRAGSSPSVQLRQAASFVKSLRKSHLKRSLFPPVLSDSVGTIHKPVVW